MRPFDFLKPKIIAFSIFVFAFAISLPFSSSISLWLLILCNFLNFLLFSEVTSCPLLYFTFHYFAFNFLSIISCFLNSSSAPSSCSLTLSLLFTLSLSQTITILHEPLAFPQWNTHDMLIMQSALPCLKTVPYTVLMCHRATNAGLQSMKPIGKIEEQTNYRPFLLVFSNCVPHELANKILLWLMSLNSQSSTWSFFNALFQGSIIIYTSYNLSWGPHCP